MRSYPLFVLYYTQETGRRYCYSLETVVERIQVETVKKKKCAYIMRRVCERR